MTRGIPSDSTSIAYRPSRHLPITLLVLNPGERPDPVDPPSRKRLLTLPRSDAIALQLFVEWSDLPQGFSFSPLVAPRGLI